MLTFLFVDESGWAWYIPLHNGTASVGVVTSKSSSTAKKQAGSARVKALSESGAGEYTLTDHYLDELFENAPTLSQLLSHATLDGYHVDDQHQHQDRLRHLQGHLQGGGNDKRDYLSSCYVGGERASSGSSGLSEPSGSPGSGSTNSGSGSQSPVKSATDFSYSATSYAGENYRIVGDAGGE